VNNSGDPSFRAANLDYDVTFVLPNDTLVAGIPTKVFTEGWSADAFADDWLARWMSPSPAKGVLITAHKYMDIVTNQLIGNTQIDGVIAANFIPEPPAGAILVIGLLILGGKCCFKKKRSRPINR
jgi:hypothetical protein